MSSIKSAFQKIWGQPKTNLVKDFKDHSLIAPGTTHKLIGNPEFAGKIPCRSEMEILPADESKNISLGRTVSETVGIGVVNPNVSRLMIESRPVLAILTLENPGLKPIYLTTFYSGSGRCKIEAMVKEEDEGWMKSSVQFDLASMELVDTNFTNELNDSVKVKMGDNNWHIVEAGIAHTMSFQASRIISREFLPGNQLNMDQVSQIGDFFVESFNGLKTASVIEE